MNKLLKQNPLLWAGLLSFALSIALSFHDVLNSDGILYLRAAREFVQYHYEAGYALFGWPFYSLLIAGFSSLTTLSLELSATLINASLMALMASGFVALTREMGATKTIQWVAVFVFLVHPGINYFREYVIRDFGAWAMLLWSLVFLCRRSALGWTLTTAIGVLFRPEGIILIALAPLALLSSMNTLSFKKRCAAILRINSLYIVLGLIGIALLLSLHLDLPANKLAKMIHSNFEILSSGFNIYTQKAQSFSQLMSVYFEHDDAIIVLVFALLFYASLLLIKMLSPLYTVLLGYAIIRRPLITAPESRLLLWVLILYTGIYLLFLMRNYFLDPRYLIPWVTVAMIWVPFALGRIWAQAPKVLKIGLGLIFLYMFLDSVLSFGYSKMYLKDAGVWIKNNTPAQTRLYTNSVHVGYYADRPLVDNEKSADAIALRYSRKTPDIHKEIAKLSAHPQEDFHNKRQDGVRVIMIQDAASK